jgi:hypothetical protein
LDPSVDLLPARFKFIFFDVNIVFNFELRLARFNFFLSPVIFVEIDMGFAFRFVAGFYYLTYSMLYDFFI